MSLFPKYMETMHVETETMHFHHTVKEGITREERREAERWLEEIAAIWSHGPGYWIIKRKK